MAKEQEALCASPFDHLHRKTAYASLVASEVYIYNSVKLSYSYGKSFWSAKVCMAPVQAIFTPSRIETSGKVYSFRRATCIYADILG